MRATKAQPDNDQAEPYNVRVLTCNLLSTVPLHILHFVYWAIGGVHSNNFFKKIVGNKPITSRITSLASRRYRRRDVKLINCCSKNYSKLYFIVRQSYCACYSYRLDVCLSVRHITLIFTAAINQLLLCLYCLAVEWYYVITQTINKQKKCWKYTYKSAY